MSDLPPPPPPGPGPSSAAAAAAADHHPSCPDDPDVVQRIVEELKSQGIFDQIRNECLAEVDTKVSINNNNNNNN